MLSTEFDERMAYYEVLDWQKEQERAYKAGRALAKDMIGEGCGSLQEIEWAVPHRMEAFEWMMRGARDAWFEYVNANP